MRGGLSRGKLTCAGLAHDAPIGILDDPPLPQADGKDNHIVFMPFGSQIGTTTIVQRLCGSNATNPNPSSGINGYRAVWSLQIDSVGTTKYMNFFLWDVCYETIGRCRDMMPQLLQNKLFVLLIPCEDRSAINRVTSWYRQNLDESKRAIIAVTRCDRIESAQIRIPSDIQNLSATLNIPVISVSAANVDVKDSKKEMQPSLKELALSIIGNFD